MVQSLRAYRVCRVLGLRSYVGRKVGPSSTIKALENSGSITRAAGAP